MAGKKGMSWYSVDFRNKVLKNRESGMTVSDVAKKYNIAEKLVKKWAKWKRENGVPKQVTGKIRKGRPKKIEESSDEKIKRLEMENQLLKKFHELLKEEHKRK